MEIRLIREEYTINSIFKLKAKYVTDVFDTNGNNIKYIYHVTDNKLEIFGDYDVIYVLFQ